MSRWTIKYTRVCRDVGGKGGGGWRGKGWKFRGASFRANDSIQEGILLSYISSIFWGTMWEELEFCLSVGGSSRKAKFWRGNFYVQVRFDLRLFRELKIECFGEKLGRII